MHTAVRPYAIRGIALVGASVIAISPIAPPLDIHLPSPAKVAAEAELAAFVNPIVNLFDVAQTSLTDLATTGGQVFANPVPVLRQIAANQFGIATTLGTAAQGTVNALAAANFPAVVRAALGQLGQGDVTGAVATINNAVSSAVVGLAFGPLAPVLSIPSVMAQNLLNVTNQIGLVVSSLGLGAVSTGVGVTTQMALSTQAFIDAAARGDVVTALSTVLNAPIDVTGALLNGGVISNGSPTLGILSPALGLLNTFVVGIPKRIADALAMGAPMTTTTSAAARVHLNSASAVPTAAAKTVTLTVPAQVKAHTARAAAPLNAGKTTISNGTGSANAPAGAAGANAAKHAGRGAAKTHSGHGAHAAKSGSHK
jgi:hypothetical protein